MRRARALLGVPLMLLSACGSAGAQGQAATSPTAARPVATAEGFGPGPSAVPSAAPSARPVARCPMFPADNAWHAEVTRLPVHPSSAVLVASIGATATVHPDFGAGLYDGGAIGIPVTTVPPGTREVTVGFDYAGESDRGPYPIPANVRIEAGSDHHILLYDPARCRLYELFAARRAADGTWKAGSGAVFDLRSNGLRRAGWTSADAAGLPITAGLVRYEEVAAGRIDHAIRVTVPRSRNAYVWPARHSASSSSDPALPPMGLRLRLKSTVDVSKLPIQARVVAQAMQRYGVIVADNGSPWFISGAPDDRWSNDALRALKGLHGSDFEAVDASGLMLSKDSGACRPGG